ncbi:MAG: hypothetical protein ACP5HM_15835 [Anaerolineae bacterium]
MSKSKFLTVLLIIAKALLSVFSFFAIIMFVVGALTTVEDVATHRRYVRRLDEVGQVAQGVVDFPSEENGWIIVDFTDASGEHRANVLEMKYYPEETWQQLAPGTEVTVRYLPYPNIDSDRIVLENELERVRKYVGFFENHMGTVTLISWALLVIKPEILYLGLVDIEKLNLLPGA